MNNCQLSRIVNNNIISDVDYSLFWNLEGLGINTMNEENVDNKSELLKGFNSDLHFENNRYSVRLLWRPNTKHLLNDNFELTSERFDKLKGRFKNDKSLFEEYKKVIKTYENERIIEKVKNTDPQNYKQCYLPHRAVIRNDKLTSKLRIVFDGSAHKKNELSLYDCLYIGPNLYPDIYELMLAFRENKIAFIGDVQQAFLQIGINVEDRDVTRFLWSDDPDNDSSTVIYRFCRVLFGINCSPFLLAATIKEHIKKFAKSTPLAYELLNERVHVDDVIGGSGSTDTAFQISSDCVEIFRDAGMVLRKLQTNDKKLRELWKNAGIDVQNEKESLGQSGFPFKVLGVCWDPEKDVFYFEFKYLLKLIDTGQITKRFILKIIGRIFDPVGFLGPFTMLLKSLVQSIWISGLEWDQELPFDMENQWREICKQFGELNDLKIPRYYFFEAAKSRIAPLKMIALPRLELLGALLSARLFRTITRAIKIPCDSFFWCDSSIVCCWIKTPAIRFKQFVRNRLEEIQEITQPKDWFHCPGIDNPADLISRGASMGTLEEIRHLVEGATLVVPSDRNVARIETLQRK
ncbi:uncharacterized protein [Parasteatoda tepidariorum]|uniref:uncharacterized protein n=1 Tax=Parasteatoda tepidariorum TaxID=114398 RepID=UPI0039BD59AF